MRFLDLEHELGHLIQILTRFVAKGLTPLLTSEVKPGRTMGWVQETNNPQILTMWQNSIEEYHNRLDEFIRWDQREVDMELLLELAESVQYWAKEYWSRGLRRGASDRKMAWAQKHYPDIPQMEQLYLERLSRLRWYKSH